MIKLADLRKEKGLTQRELAKIFNISSGNICDYEKGRIEPSIDRLIAFSNFFGVSVDELLGRTNIVGVVELISDLAVDEKNLVESYRQMDEAEKAILNEYTEILLRNHKKITNKSIK